MGGGVGAPRPPRPAFWLGGDAGMMGMRFLLSFPRGGKVR
jgi:hypothetical protein